MGKTVAQFIDYAMVVVIILIIWYVGKFFFVSPPTKAERDARRAEASANRERALGWFKDKMEADKKAGEHGRRHDEVAYIRRHLLEAQTRARHAIHSLELAERASDESSRHRVARTMRRDLRRLEHELHRAVRALDHRKHDEKHFPGFADLAGSAGSLLTQVEHALHTELDELEDAVGESGDTWDSAVAKLKEMIHDDFVRGCGAIVKNLDEFIKNDKMDSLGDLVTASARRQAQQNAAAGQVQQGAGRRPRAVVRRRP